MSMFDAEGERVRKLNRDTALFMDTSLSGMDIKV